MEKRRPEKPSDKAKRKRDRELNDIRTVLNLPEGRRVVWRILSFVKIFIDAFFGGDAGHTTAYQSGRKSVGLWLLSELMDANPNSFSQMQREYNSELKREAMDEQEYIEQKDILKTDE